MKRFYILIILVFPLLLCYQKMRAESLDEYINRLTETYFGYSHDDDERARAANSFDLIYETMEEYAPNTSSYIVLRPKDRDTELKFRKRLNQIRPLLSKEMIEESININIGDLKIDSPGNMELLFLMMRNLEPQPYVPFSLRLNLREKVGRAGTSSLTVDQYINESIALIQECFDYSVDGHPVVNSISLPLDLKCFWLTICALADIDFNRSFTALDRITFTLIKDWLWINAMKVDDSLIQKITESLCNRASTPEDCADYIERSQTMRAEIDNLHLYPFTRLIEDYETLGFDFPKSGSLVRCLTGNHSHIPDINTITLPLESTIDPVFQMADGSTNLNNIKVVDYLQQNLNYIDRFFGYTPYRGSRINSVILTNRAEGFWFVLSILSRGEIEFSLSRNEVSREEFDTVKKWCSINSERIDYDIIEKILNMLRQGKVTFSDSVPACDIHPYSELRSEIEALNLFTISDILQP